jgi:transglutaminase-like putative cysteine protease
MAYRFSWIAGATAIVLALLRMDRLLRPIESGPPWQLALLAGALLGGVITWTALSYRVGRWGTGLLNLGGILLAAFRLGASDTLLLGFLPSLDTFETLRVELGYAIELIRFGAAPVFPAAGLILILTIIFWVLGTLLSWGLLSNHPTLALLPPLLFYLQIATIDRIPPRAGWTTAFLVVVALALLAVALDERSLTAGRLRRSFAPGHVPMSAPLFPSVFLIVAVATSVVLSGVATGLVPASGFLNWRAQTGLGGGIFSGVSFNLFANITQTDLVSRSEETVFIVELEGDEIPGNLYWKLFTLEEFDGDNWFPGRLTTRTPRSDAPWEDPEHAFRGETVPVTQNFTIVKLAQNALPNLHSATYIQSEQALLNQSFRVRADASIPFDLRTWEGLTYQVISNVPVPDLGVLASQPGRRDRLSPIFQEAADRGVFTAQPKAPPAEGLVRPEDINDYLDLPGEFDPTLGTKAAELTEDGTTAFEKALLLEAWFRDPSEFTYTIDIDPGHSANNLADWILDEDSPNYRRGYCEQFATAMAAMARAIGIPSRVVLGFTPGETLTDGRILVKGKNAHAWVELWMNGQGWVRFDPTPRGDGVNPSANVNAAGIGFDAREFIPPPAEPIDPTDPGATPPPTNPGEFDFGDENQVPVGPIANPEFFTGWRVTPFQGILIGLAALVGAIPLTKWIRRRRRLSRLKHGDITGAWDEIVDRLTDYGRPPTPDQTPAEVATSVHRSLRPLARNVAESLYGPDRPMDPAKVEQAAASFEETESYLREIYRPFDRMTAWLRPASINWRVRPGKPSVNLRWPRQPH